MIPNTKIKNHIKSHKLILPILAATFILALSALPVVSAEGTNAASNVTKLSRTVGLDIVTNIVNPDKTVSLTFRWSEKGKTFNRIVTINDDTIVVYNGKLKKFSDLTPDDLRAKAVATVGPDGITTMLLRFGKAPLPKDQLTPEQLKMLASLAPTATPASDEALNKRVSSIVESLALTDTAKEERVRNMIATDLKAVRDAHNAGLQLDPSIHTNFITGLQAELTPEQVESIKDKLTVNKLPITFKVYHQILPNLKPEDEHYILTQLTDAREQSLDVKNVDEMTPIFKKHKTEIEHYLNDHGYDWDKSYKTFVDGEKSGAKNSETNSTPAAK